MYKLFQIISTNEDKNSITVIVESLIREGEYKIWNLYRRKNNFYYLIGFRKSWNAEKEEYEMVPEIAKVLPPLKQEILAKLEIGEENNIGEIIRMFEVRRYEEYENEDKPNKSL